MSRMTEIVADLEAEASELDRLLSRLTDEQWLTPTPAAGWDVRDTVSHLADTDDIAYDCATGGPRDLLEEGMGAGSGDAFTHGQVVKGRAMPPATVHDWWRTSSRKLWDVMRDWDPSERIKWGPNVISAASFMTARLMETWAHSLDCHGAVGAHLPDTDRLRHVCHLGWRALPHAFALRGESMTGPVRLELTSPSGQPWEFGPAGAATVITGSAGDWARTVVQRDRQGERRRLEVRGPDGRAILDHAQAYLG
ncbi:MAG TPA: maleylpyruvate isomerase family mycothiol-dependent enzyme [Actinomycetota bacterium]|nr:maleylpyruvate isomerase family mycothiol-dependent enzyme [Actinomycetota bacterium]